MVRGRAQVVAGNQNWNTQMEGGNEDYIAIRNWTLQSGENFTARDILLADKVALLGATVAKVLFPDTDPDRTGHPRQEPPFRVVGVLNPKGQGQFGNDQDDLILAPYTTLQKKLLGITHLNQITVSARSADDVEPTAVAITRLMRQRHRTTGPDDDDFTVRTVEEMAATRVEMANTMTMLLMSVASVSLLVGGIGIMNIMLVSVTERTREIGLRMAVGARTRDILRQFLAEAIGPLHRGRRGRRRARAGRVPRPDPGPGLADRHHAFRDRDRVRLRGRGGDLLRVLPGAEGGEPRSHRRATVRMM